MNSEVNTASSREAELRQYMRKALEVPARLLGHDAVPRPVKLLDISCGGIGLIAGEAMQANDACALAFDVELNDEAKRINVWAKVAYCFAQGEGMFRIGIRYRDYDSHSRMHIERLCDAGGLPAGW